MVETPAYACDNVGAGGFLPNGSTSLPSPALSTASNRAAARLPRPRSKPLARGSRKEDYARNYVSERLMHISRRYVKKHGIPDPADEVTGYNTMDELCKDLEDVVDVLWFSGTPSLQIPYLLNVALAFNTYLPSFSPSPRPTFALLKKLDHCFASLLVGRDIKSGALLPGFQGGGRGFTRTDMVRCKSLADETRMLVAMVMSDEPDVGTFAEAGDDDDGPAQSPVRRNIGVSFSTGLIQTPIPDISSDSGSKVKSEDIIDFEAESDSTDSEEPRRIVAKRKSDAADLRDDIEDDSKRIKIKEEGDADPKPGDAAPGDRSPVETVGRPGPQQSDGKFHWMVDDEEDSDDEVSPNMPEKVSSYAGPSSAVQMAPDTEHEVGEPNADIDEEEEEDEELHLNVGQVYEKTLVQLGRSLGESITDE